MANNTTQITIGIDLSDSKHSVCVLDSNGSPLKETTIPNSHAGLNTISEEFPSALIAMEVGTHSPWISHHLKELGHKVIVANARKLRAIYTNERKSDKKDAYMLAKLARVDKDLLYPIEHGSLENLQDKQRLATRDTLVKQRVALINSVRFSLKSQGIKIATTSSAYFVAYAQEFLSEHQEALSLVTPLLEVIRTITEQIKKLDKYIKDVLAKKHSEVQFLTQVTGVGIISAISYILVIQDPDRFKNPRDVAAYLGLVPRRDQSGEVDKQLPISKTGNNQLRTLLVQCAQYILRSTSPDSDLKRLGLRIAERGNKIAKRKAIIAVARKLSVILLTLWKRNLTYVPIMQQRAS